MISRPIDTKNTDTQNKHFTTAEGHSLNVQELYEAIESVLNKPLWNISSASQYTSSS